MRRSPCRALWQGKKERTEMSTEQQVDVSLSATPPLSEILDAHAKLETQVGEISSPLPPRLAIPRSYGHYGVQWLWKREGTPLWCGR
jgi:hypothetical protein